MFCYQLGFHRCHHSLVSFQICGLALIAVSMWGYYDNNFEKELKAELAKDNLQYARQGVDFDRNRKIATANVTFA